MTDYDITPASGSTPKVRLYHDSLDAIPRAQMAVVERHSVIEGATPASDSDGLQPGDIRFHGFWLGTEASTLADRLRDDILDDPDVTRVDVQAVDDDGNNETNKLNGTYRIADESTITRPLADDDRIYEYNIVLVED